MVEYTTAFRTLCARIHGITDDEMLHRYVEGLIPTVRDVVDLNAQPTTFAEACVAAERAAYRGK